MWLPREDILHFEEIETLVDVFTGLGVDKVRLTGGEPLLRRDVADLVRRLAARPAIRDLAMTTNGVLLAANARALRDAGLHRLTVSLDTLQPAALPRSDPLRRAGSRPRWHRHRRTALSRPQDRHRRHQRRQRRRVDRPARVRPPDRRRGPVHRIHGRGRRHALVDAAGDAAARDAGAARAALRRRSRR